MRRWHKVRTGRIVASCECETGDGAEAMLAPTKYDKLMSDEDWRAMGHRGALRGWRPTLTMQDRAEQVASHSRRHRDG